MARTSIKTSDLANSLITAAKIADGAVEESKIAAGAVTAAKIGAGAVETAKIADGAVSTAKIADDSVTASKILAGAVGTSELADDAVTSGKILNGAVGTDELAANAVTAAKADLTGAWSFSNLQGTMGANLAAAGFKITGLGTPTASGDAATMGYVDSVAQGLDVKASVSAIARTSITLSGTQTIDGVAVVAGDRVLVSAQTNAQQNGIYVVAAGAWSRSADLASGANAAGAFTFVEQGTANADSGWVCTSNPAVVGTDNLAFSQFSGAGSIIAGNGLSKTGNTLDVGQGAGITVTSDAVEVRLAASASALDFDLGGLRVAPTSIDAGKLASNAVTEVKIAGNAVTTAKINDGAVTELKLANSAVTGSKIADGAVSVSKLDATLKGTLGKFDYYQSGTLSGAGSTVALSNTPNSADSAMLVFVNGVMRTKGLDYTLSGSSIVFEAGVGAAADDYAVFYGASR